MHTTYLEKLARVYKSLRAVGYTHAHIMAMDTHEMQRAFDTYCSYPKRHKTAHPNRALNPCCHKAVS